MFFFQVRLELCVYGWLMFLVKFLLIPVGGLGGCSAIPSVCKASYKVLCLDFLRPPISHCAELFAVGFVLHHALEGGFRVKIYTDCFGVVDKLRLLTHGKPTRADRTHGTPEHKGHIVPLVGRESHKQHS